MARRYKTSKGKRIAQKRYRKLKSQYRDYLKQFESRKALFAERGLDFYEPYAFNFRDWKEARLEKINDLKIDIKEGRRKSIGNVNREIVSDQAYELSSRQAEAVAGYLFENESEILEEMDLAYKYTDEAGQERINLKKKIDLMMKIRQGEFIKEDIGLWDMINDFRDRYFALNKKEQENLMKKWAAKTYPEAVAKEVGQTFFNSPE